MSNLYKEQTLKDIYVLCYMYLNKMYKKSMIDFEHTLNAFLLSNKV